MTLNAVIQSAVQPSQHGVRDGASLSMALAHSWWDFADPNTVTDSSGITNVTNKGRSGIPLVHNSGVKMTYSNRRAVCNGSQNDYRAGGVSDFKFLHDGTGGTVFFIHKQDGTESDESFPLISNVSSGSSPGMSLRTDLASNQRYRWILRGTSATFAANGNDSDLTADTPVVYSCRFAASTAPAHAFEQYEDGVKIAGIVDTGFSYSTADHNDPLRVAVSTTGEILGVVMFDRRLTENEHRQVLRQINHYYGLTEARVGIIIGASNAEGLGSTGSISASYDQKIPGSSIFAHEDLNTANDLTFLPHTPANSQVDKSASTYGLDLALAHQWFTNTNKKLWLLKSTVSGSDLYAFWNPDDQPALASAWDEFLERLLGDERMVCQNRQSAGV